MSAYSTNDVCAKACLTNASPMFVRRVRGRRIRAGHNLDMSITYGETECGYSSDTFEESHSFSVDVTKMPNKDLLITLHSRKGCSIDIRCFVNYTESKSQQAAVIYPTRRPLTQTYDIFVHRYAIDVPNNHILRSTGCVCVSLQIAREEIRTMSLAPCCCVGRKHLNAGVALSYEPEEYTVPKTMPKDDESALVWELEESFFRYPFDHDFSIHLNAGVIIPAVKSMIVNRTGFFRDYVRQNEWRRTCKLPFTFAEASPAFTFLYFGKHKNPTPAKVITLLRVASMIEFKSLFDACVVYLANNVTAENVDEITQVARETEAVKLLKALDTYHGIEEGK